MASNETGEVLDRLEASLNATNVLSPDYASTILGYAYKVAEVAHRNGREEARSAMARENGVKREDMGGGRGLGQYGEPVADTHEGTPHETTITVSDSSAAMEECMWLRLSGEAHLSEVPRPIAGIPHGVAKGDMSAHLNLERAVAVRDRLDAWIASVR